MIGNISAETAQSTVEGLSALFILTNDTQDIDRYYHKITEKFPNLPRTEKLSELINKHNVTYPIKIDGNIVLGRIEISHFNNIFDKLERKKGDFAKFNIKNGTAISKQPTKLSTWYCNPGYIIYDKSENIVDNSLSKEFPEKFLSRAYSYDEIKESLLLINERVGYRVP